MDFLDVESFRLKEPFARTQPRADGAERTNGTRSRYSGTRGEFLKGPVPLKWLQATERLGRKSLVVAIEIWTQTNMRGGLMTNSGGIAFSTKRLKVWNVDRRTAYRVLRKMEAAGLISVSRSRGSLARVTIHPDAPGRVELPDVRADLSRNRPDDVIISGCWT